jgi:hypothetical protein
MESDRAIEVWRHHGWGGVVGWIVQRVPRCDPTVAAVHAVRRAPSVRDDSEEAFRLAEFLLRTARRSPADRWPRNTDPVRPDATVQPPCRPATSSASLSIEAEQLLDEAGITLDEATRCLVSESVDIAVDWWADFSDQAGIRGEALLTAARTTDRINGRVRLRSRFSGAAGRPLVALLLGGDQRARRAREASGMEVGLIFWALLTRRAQIAGRPVPQPPAAVTRAWSMTIAQVEALTRSGGARSQRPGPPSAA